MPKIPKQVKIGNRSIKVQIVDYDSPSHKFDDDDFVIEVNNDITPKLQYQRFWEGLVRVTFDYIDLLDEIEKEVGDSDLPDLNTKSFGAVMKQVIDDNNLDK